MPHGRYIKTAAETQILGHVGKVHRKHQDVGNTFIPFTLEVMFGKPQRVVSELVHASRESFGLGEYAGQLLIRINTLVDGRRILAHLTEIDMPGEQR